MSCQGFCKKQINEKTGLKAVIAPDSQFPEGKIPCPLGFTHNPKTLKSTANMIEAGGRLSICQENKWKWMKVS